MALTIDALPHPSDPHGPAPAGPLALPDAEPPTASDDPRQPHRGGGVVTLAWELRTGPVRRSYRRDFPALSRWLCGLDRARRFRQVPAARSDAASDAIASQFETARTLFDETTRQHDRHVAAAGFGHVPFHDPATLTVAVPVVAPLAHRYLRLLAAADDAFASVERAWLLGLVDHRLRRQQEHLLQKALHAVTAQVREQYSGMARWLTQGRHGLMADAVGAGHAAELPPSDDSGPDPTPWWAALDASAEALAAPSAAPG